jgi:LacI family repressor for deo operon, udp, cdd, tsx, nupC, and nupG
MIKTIPTHDVLTKPANMIDVARLANVSQVTVSRVFSGTGPVAESTRQKVKLAARKLNYSPNALARGLRGSRTKTMAIVWSQSSEELPLIRDITLPMQDRGYVVHIADHLHDIEVLKKILTEYSMRGVDALVIELVFALERSREIETLLQKFPAVVLVTDIPLDSRPILNVDCVSQDHSVSIRAAIDHFVSIGRQRISYITSNNIANRNKIDIFMNLVTQYGLPTRIIDIPGEFVSVNNFPQASEILDPVFQEGHLQPDAILCDNNDRAFSLIAYLKSKGYCVPKDVAVIGREDTFSASYFTPPLASTRRQHRKVAECVEQMLSNRLDDSSIDQQFECIPMEFLWRESAGKKNE